MQGTNWTAQYFNSTDLSGLSAYTEVLPEGISKNWGNDPPKPYVSRNFSARFSTLHIFDAGIYEFTIAYIGGVRIFINERVVFELFYENILLQREQFRVRLEDYGRYALKVEYFSAASQAAIMFHWHDAGYQEKIEKSTIVANVWPQLLSDPVKQAILEAEHWVQLNRPASAVDRVHTALHGYLRLACHRSEITFSNEDTIMRLLKLLRQKHPIFLNHPQKQELEKILSSFGTILNELNSLRNNASLAHPNDELLQHEDAMLAINAARSILNYLDAKLNKSTESTT